MNEVIKNKCDLLVANSLQMEKEFKWEYSLMNISAAMVFSGAGKEVDVQRLKESKKILKEKTGVFSIFRSQTEPIVVSKMALAADPAQYLDDLMLVYDKVSKGTIFDNGHQVQASIIICDAQKVAQADAIVDKYKELYKKMSKEHPMLTSSEDTAFAMLLAMTDKPVDTIISEMEECYTYMKKDVKISVVAEEFKKLSEVLTLTSGDMKEKCDKVAALYNAFKDHGMKYGSSYNEFASLGALIDLNVDTDALVVEIIETADYMKESKVFGKWSMDKKQRLMFAAMLVGDFHCADNMLLNQSALSSTVAMVIAEEIAIMMCIMAATTSTTTN